MNWLIVVGGKQSAPRIVSIEFELILEHPSFQSRGPASSRPQQEFKFNDPALGAYEARARKLSAGWAPVLEPLRHVFLKIVHRRTLSLNELLRRARIEWHGVSLKHPDWSEQSWSLRTRFVLHRILNAYWEPLQFQLPPSPSADRDEWRRCIDPALPSPEDIQPWEDAPVVKQTTYLVQPRSIVLLALALDEGAEAHQIEATQVE